MPVSIRILVLLLSTAALTAQAEESLPLPMTLMPPVPENNGILPRVSTAPHSGGFIKPTKSIKPPAAAVATTATSQALPPPIQIVSSPTAETRLRRLVVVNGSSMNSQAIHETIVASSNGRMPVTVAGGVSASAPVLTDLAGLFGSAATPDTQQKVIDTVKKGMGSATKPLTRVEVVGWVPSQGVMAIAVYPES